MIQLNFLSNWQSGGFKLLIFQIYNICKIQHLSGFKLVEILGWEDEFGWLHLILIVYIVRCVRQGKLIMEIIWGCKIVWGWGRTGVYEGCWWRWFGSYPRSCGRRRRRRGHWRGVAALPAELLVHLVQGEHGHSGGGGEGRDVRLITGSLTLQQ